MTVLLDSHTFLWFCQDDPALSSTARSLIEGAGNRKLLSIASCWEVSIKSGLGKLTLGEPSGAYLAAALSKTSIELLPISLAHATFVESLPLHHRDPFDRMLIAQATIEGYAIVSADAAFDAYGVQRLW